MLRLWHERVVGGLFPDQCWLRVRRNDAVVQPGDARADAQGMLRRFDALLAQHATPSWRGNKVSLTVSDTVAAILPLPWQERLIRPAEIDAYARALFERTGQALDGSWALRSHFRHYRAMGLAYAVPKAWLGQLDELISAHGMRLDSILPVSAAAFGMCQRPRHPKTTAIFLREATRTSALVHDASGLIAYAVEPATSTHQDAAARLLARIGGTHDVAAVGAWPPSEADDTAWPALVARFAPAAACARIPLNAWD